MVEAAGVEPAFHLSKIMILKRICLGNVPLESVFLCLSLGPILLLFFAKHRFQFIRIHSCVASRHRGSSVP